VAAEPRLSKEVPLMMQFVPLLVSAPAVSTFALTAIAAALGSLPTRRGEADVAPHAAATAAGYFVASLICIAFTFWLIPTGIGPALPLTGCAVAVALWATRMLARACRHAADVIERDDLAAARVVNAPA
jgi:hypothetical protein